MMQMRFLLIFALFIITSAFIPLRPKNNIAPIPCPTMIDSQNKTVTDPHCLNPEGWALLKAMEKEQLNMEEIVAPRVAEIAEIITPNDVGFFNRVVDKIKAFF